MLTNYYTVFGYYLCLTAGWQALCCLGGPLQETLLFVCLGCWAIAEQR